MDRDEEPCSTLKPSCDAQTQWSDPEMEDHTYSKGPTITCRASTTPSPELSCPVADNVLKSDADSLLYTGIPLIAFHTLVTCLQPFAPTSSSMPVVDHILMTLMKLRLNFVMTGVVWRNGASQGQVSKTVGIWIDIMSENTKDLVIWLPREKIKKLCCPKLLKNTFQTQPACVIDCAETVLQKAKFSWHKFIMASLTIRN
ncbi:hypothetical protein PO909_033225 [Leuciscus waleckii]